MKINGVKMPESRVVIFLTLLIWSPWLIFSNLFAFGRLHFLKLKDTKQADVKVPARVVYETPWYYKIAITTPLLHGESQEEVFVLPRNDSHILGHSWGTPAEI